VALFEIFQKMTEQASTERFILPTYESDKTVSSLPRYFTPKDVANHNSASDCWVSFLGKVYNLTPLIRDFKGDG
jgi:cytochrome b involved in lipid metabolism